MKKQLVYTTIITVALSFAQSAYAVTASPTPTKAASASATVAPTSADKDVKSLREKVAAKVSELKKKNHKPFAGEITALSDNTLTVSNANGVTMEVKIDSTLTTIYQIAGSTTKEIDKDDLKKGNYIIVTGPVLEKTITANLIYVDETFIVGSGKITEVDTATFFIKVIGQDKTTYTFDIERTTQLQLLNIKTLVPEKITFTKLKEGDLVHFVAEKPTEKDVTRSSAKRLLVVPQEYFNK